MELLSHGDSPPGRIPLKKKLQTAWAAEIYQVEAPDDEEEAFAKAADLWAKARPNVIGLVVGLVEVGRLTNGLTLYQVRVEPYRDKEAGDRIRSLLR